jgi:hypothetical protein
MNLTLRARYTLAIVGLIVTLSLALYLTLQWRSLAAIESITNSSTSKVESGLSAQAENAPQVLRATLPKPWKIRSINCI